MTAPTSPNPDTLSRITRILGGSLLLGDAEITPDQPLLHSDLDFDSLDALLLVTSIEKEFGVRIPNEVLN